jgi:nicotinate phosphoribosyltransferase
VSKRSWGKETTGGRKWAYRVLDAGGRAREERILAAPGPEGRPLQVPVLRDGEVVHRPSLAAIREHHAAALAELPPEALLLEAGPPALRG